VGKVSKEKKKRKKPGGGRGENKVVKKTEIRADQGRERANKRSQPGMAQG
jgi:hypothetical protein